MAGKRREEVQEHQIDGLKYFDKLAPLLERLHDDGCARDRAGNRKLHFDQYCLLILHFEVDRHVPTRIDVTPNGGGAHDERAVLERTIQADHTYVMDRGYAKFALFNKIVAAKNSYVCRLRDNSVYDILEQRPLTDADRAANVLSDQIVSIGQHGKTDARPHHPIRVITVRISPHTSRGKYKGGSTGPSSDGILRVATNLLDVPAEVIALIYIERWQIEVSQPEDPSSAHLYHVAV